MTIETEIIQGMGDDMEPKKEPTGFAAGELMYFSSGAYSDYSVDGVFKVQKAFELEDVISVYRDEFCTKHEYINYFKQPSVDWKENYQADGYIGFIAWMTREGYVDPIAYKEVHISDYTGFDPTIMSW
jgi:hypothetical protein